MTAATAGLAAPYGQGWPVVDWWTGGWIGGTGGGLQRIRSVANRDTKILPAQVDMYGTIYDRLNQMLNKGRGPSEAVEAKPAKEYEAHAPFGAPGATMGNSPRFREPMGLSFPMLEVPDA